MVNAVPNSEQINSPAEVTVAGVHRHGRSWIRRAACAGIAVGLAATVLVATSGHVSEPADLTNPVLKLRAARVTSSFENSTTDIQYGYAEDIGDGRGITAGRAGFTSGTGDMLKVVERYNSEKPGNSLSPFLPALHTVNGTDKTTGLKGLAKAWKTEANDLVFRSAQDKVYDELYFDPAMKWTKKENVRSALGQLIILDTIIQHGEGDDPDGLPAIVNETVKVDPPQKTTEQEWLGTFLKIRERHLMHAVDPSTRQDWIDSVDRVHALNSFLIADNMSLKLPLHWNVFGDPYSIDK